MKKQIIGNTTRTYEKIPDLTDEIIAAANAYVEPKVPKSKNKKPKTIETKVQTIPLTGNLSFITDKNLFKEINKYLKKDHPNLENPLEFKDGVMKQSNSYVATAVDMYLNKINSEYRLATQLDLEQDLPFTEGTYNDSGLALRNLTGANEEQAKHLFKQLKRRGIKEKDLPLWFNLRGLTLDKDLNFNLTDESFYKTAESLNWKNGTSFSKINDFGLPKEKDENSSRQIWTNSDYALSRCYLDSISNLDSDGSNLLDSGGSGRVVLAKLRSG